MNTLEAIFSFLVLLSLLPFIINIPDYSVDNSHYSLKLAEDIWRVLYLRGDLEGFDKDALNKDVEEISTLTSLCISVEEEDVASCIPEGQPLVIKRIAFIKGNPKIISLKIGVNND